MAEAIHKSVKTHRKHICKETEERFVDMDLLQLTLVVFMGVLVTRNISADPQCEQITLCNGEVSYSETPHYAMSFANVSCDLGYMLSGSDNLTCSYNASIGNAYWIPEEPTCEINDCGAVTLEHGLISYSYGTKYGSTATFYCESGYELSGESSISCQEDESWSEDVPTCVSGVNGLKYSLLLILASFALWLFTSV